MYRLLEKFDGVLGFGDQALKLPSLSIAASNCALAAPPSYFGDDIPTASKESVGVSFVDLTYLWTLYRVEDFWIVWSRLVIFNIYNSRPFTLLRPNSGCFPIYFLLPMIYM